MFRTRTGLAACANVRRRALRFLPLDFAQTASPILILPGAGAKVAQHTWSTHAVPIAAGGARRGRF
jgi:hypothetical protein